MIVQSAKLKLKFHFILNNHSSEKSSTGITHERESITRRMKSYHPSHFTNGS